MKKMKVILGVILTMCLTVKSYGYVSTNRVDNFSNKPWVLQVVPLPGMDHIVGSVKFQGCEIVNGPCTLPVYSIINMWYYGDQTNLVLGQMKITDYKNTSMFFAFDNYNDAVMEIEPKDTSGVVSSNSPNMGDISIGASDYESNNEIE